jgi:hypothetical protein
MVGVTLIRTEERVIAARRAPMKKQGDFGMPVGLARRRSRRGGRIADWTTDAPVVQAEGLGEQSLGHRPRSGRKEAVIILLCCPAL